MRSLVAWSQDREAKGQEAEALQTAGRRLEEEACLSELNDIAAKLADGLPFYGAIECMERQRSMLNGWMVDQSRLIKEGVEAQIADVKQTLLRSVSQVVAPLLTQALKDKAVTDVCGLLESKFSDLLPEHAVIKVPEALHDAFVAQLTQRGLRLTVEAAQVEELSIQTGDTRIETQLLPAMASLEKVLAA